MHAVRLYEKTGSAEDLRSKHRSRHTDIEIMDITRGVEPLQNALDKGQKLPDEVVVELSQAMHLFVNDIYSGVAAGTPHRSIPAERRDVVGDAMRPANKLRFALSPQIERLAPTHPSNGLAPQP